MANFTDWPSSHPPFLMAPYAPRSSGFSHLHVRYQGPSPSQLAFQLFNGIQNGDDAYMKSASYLRELLDQIEREIILSMVCATSLKPAFREMLDMIVDTYTQELAGKEKRTSFKDRSIRWAYVYVFLMRHSHLVYQSLRNLQPITHGYNMWRNLQRINLCAIGGGPGSDVIGVALFLKHFGFQGKLSAIVLDKCSEWECTWQSLSLRLKDLPLERVKYKFFDFLAADVKPEIITVIKGANLITIMKAVSSVSAFLKEKPLQSRLSFLRFVTPGTYVLFIDNSNGPHNDLFLQAAAVFGFHVVFALDTEFDFPKIKSKNEPFIDWLSFYPARMGSNKIILLQKLPAF